MRSISQRELRNDNATIMREVEEGASFVVTRRGVPVASLGPVGDDLGMRCVKPAKRRMVARDLPRVRTAETTSDVLDDLRGAR